MKKIIYRLLRYFNYLLIVGLLCAYLSVYINPEKIWLFAFFGLAYPFLLLANIVFIIFWISKKKKFFLIPLLAILIGWTYMSSLIQIQFKRNTRAPETENSFNILSYNVRLFDLYDWEESKNTAEKIFEFINNEDPDIICFQEFYTQNSDYLTEDLILKSLEDKYYYHIDYTIQNNKYNYGIATYSRYPIINKGVIQFNNSSNTSIYTDVIINKDTVRIFNNHLQSIRFNRNNYSFITNSKALEDDERMKEIKDISTRIRDAFVKRAAQTKTIARHIKNSPYPIFICGDFNDVPVSYTYHAISKGLKDSFREAGNGIGNTYIGKFPSFRIDYILHSKTINCLDFEIKKVKLSDHYPIKGKFYIDSKKN